MTSLPAADMTIDITFASLSLTWLNGSLKRTGSGTFCDPKNAPIMLHSQNCTGMAPVRIKPCEKILPIASKVLCDWCKFYGNAKATLTSSPLKYMSNACSQKAEKRSWVRPPKSSPCSSVNVTFMVEDATSSLL